jgi:PAS domain S-box-containing protein
MAETLRSSHTEFQAAGVDAVETTEPVGQSHTPLLLLECMGQGVCGLDRQGRFTYLNPAAARMLGLDRERAIGQSMHALTHPSGMDGSAHSDAECPICRSLKTEQGCHVEHEVFWRPDRTSLPVEYSVFPLREGDAAQGVVLAFTDISQRRLHSPDMRHILASAQCLLWYADVQYIREKGMMRWFLWPADLEAALRFLSISIEEGQNFAQAFYACRLDEDKERTDGFGQENILAGRSYRQEYRLRRTDGAVRWIAEDVQVEEVAEGRWRAAGVCTDITELKRRELEIEALNERLQRAMAETHHRVKNNLQVLSALIDLQVTRDEETIPAHELVRIGQHIRALATIHDLLTQEAKESGAAEYVSTRDALHRLMPLVQSMVGSRALRYRADDVRLPIRKGTSLAVLVNELVSNAVKHGMGEIVIALTAGGETIRLEVCDDGDGFPAGFDPNAAAHTGLELIESLSRWDLQGDVRYENRPEGGARVVVIFPAPSPERD